MLQNIRATAFTVSDLLRENRQGGKSTPPSPPRLRLESKLNQIKPCLIGNYYDKYQKMQFCIQSYVDI